MKKAILAILAICALVIAAPFLHRPDASLAPTIGPPWQIEMLPDGKSRVFGILLDQSTLAEAGTRLDESPALAVVAAGGETGTLEAYFEQVRLGALTGKMILVADIPDDELRALQARAVKVEPQESGSRRFSLGTEDRQNALGLKVKAITFVPSARLERQTIVDRFGIPGETLTAGDAEHFLYPERGLDLALSAGGKAVLQYVAPARFALLKEPLGKAGVKTGR